MKRLKLLFDASDITLTAAVFVLITALVPMEIILRLINQVKVKGIPCLYDAFINVNMGAVWRYVIPFVLFYVLYVQKYDMNSAIVIRRKNVRRVWLNSQINMVVAAAFFSLYCAVVTGIAGWIMTGKVCNWGEKFSRAFFAKGEIIESPPQIWLLITAFIIDTFVCLYVSGTLMMLVWWLTNKQWIGFLAAIGVTSFEHIAGRGYLSFYYTLNEGIFMTGLSLWKNIIYPMVLYVVVVLITVVVIRRKDFFR